MINHRRFTVPAAMLILIGVVALGWLAVRTDQDALAESAASPPESPESRLWAAQACCIPELPEASWAALRYFNLPLNNPPIIPAAEAEFLRPEDTVVGVLHGKRARAYPWFMLANYHAVNDTIGADHVIVNLCEACNGGAAFLAYVGDMAIDFRPCGLKKGTWYAIDFQTGSYWYPFVGEAFEGPLKGTKLKRIRTYFGTWADWVAAHPHTTVVLTNDEVRNRPHGRESHMAAEFVFDKDFMRHVMKSTPNPRLELMKPYKLVYGLIGQDQAPAMACTLQHLQSTGPVQTRIGDDPVLLLIQNDYQVGAYIARLGDVELKFTTKSTDPVQLTDQLGNTWDAWGRTIAGPNHRAELPVADGYLTKWYEWVENFPDTEVMDKPGE